MELTGNIAVVSGGGSGLGAATARRFAEQGARVAVLDIDAAAAHSIADEIGGIAIIADVGDQESVDTALEQVQSVFGSVPRIVVNCAGIGMAARIVAKDGSPSFDVFEKTLRINLFGTYHVMTHTAKRMMALSPLDDNERGVIINTASVAWQDGQLGQAAYAASKGAIASMCLPAAREFARAGIRVMTIAPGLFHTPMMEGLPEDVVEQITANIPFPARLGLPEEYALSAQQVVENKYLNGTTIRLDGAVRLPPK